jgi:hypothetical protein
MFRVGLLTTGPDPTDQGPFARGLIHGHARHGLILGQSLAFERRAANGHLDRLPELLSELIAVKVDLIVTSGYPAARVVKERTKLPVVMAREGDPVAINLNTAERIGLSIPPSLLARSDTVVESQENVSCRRTMSLRSGPPGGLTPSRPA